MMSKLKKEKCPLCPNHCPIDHPKCEKGQEYTKNGRSTAEKHDFSHKHFKGFHGGKGEKFKMDPADDRLSCLLLYSSGYLHKMFHQRNIEDEKRLFSCLDEEEQKQLKMLLQKLLSHWGQSGRKTE